MWRSLHIVYYKLKHYYFFLIITNEVIPIFVDKKSLTNEEMQKLDKVIQQDIESLAISFLSINFGFVFFKGSFGERLTTLSSDEYIQNSIKVFVKGIQKV